MFIMKTCPKSPDGKLLRRHGDQIKLFPHGHYCILGRVDDTMKLGGIKISAAEIERTLIGLPHIMEVAAIAVPPPDRGAKFTCYLCFHDKSRR